MVQYSMHTRNTSEKIGDSQTTVEDTLETLPRNAQHRTNFQHWDHNEQGEEFY